MSVKTNNTPIEELKDQLQVGSMERMRYGRAFHHRELIPKLGVSAVKGSEFVLMIPELSKDVRERFKTDLASFAMGINGIVVQTAEFAKPQWLEHAA